MVAAVLVIDMLRGFLEEGHPLYCGNRARRIIPRVKRLLEKESAAGNAVFFVCDRHAPDDPEFRMFPPHCIAGTEEAEIISELSRFRGTIIPKRRYSAFYGTTLERRLKRLGVQKLILCGVCTDICVLHTAADARNRDYLVEVPTDAVAAMSPAAHRFALAHMEKVLGVMLTRPGGARRSS